MTLTANEIGILIGNDELTGMETFTLVKGRYSEKELKEKLKQIREDWKEDNIQNYEL